MKLFISWSGAYSQGVALALKEWLPLIFNPVDVFVSSDNIRKGKRWPQEIAKELETTNYGIACLTHDNLTAPWLLFETGALSKLPESSVSTLLLGGLGPSDIGTSPLSHFQHTLFEKDDVWKLVKAINEAQGTIKRDATTLEKIFEKCWSELEATVTKAATKREKNPEAKRSVEDMVRELLEVTNSIARNLPKPRPSVFDQMVEDIVQSKHITDPDTWDRVRLLIARKSPFLNAYLKDAMHVSFENDIFTVYFSPEQQEDIELINNDRSKTVLKHALGSLGYHTPAKIAFGVLAPVQAPAPNSAIVPPPKKRG